MRIAINGAGIAGPNLAWWLKRYGYEPVLLERAPALRSGGYAIDFWGVGYDIAEKMGILPDLEAKGYKMESLQIVNRKGTKRLTLEAERLWPAIGGRFLTIARSDLASTIYEACGEVETRFGTSVTGVEQRSDGVTLQLSDGSEEAFDLLVGADGLHSRVRAEVFGPDEAYEHHLGAYVAAFTLPDYQPRDELTYVTLPTSKKMVARMSMRNEQTLFLFTFRPEGIEPEMDPKALLRSQFGEMGWEVPTILKRLDEVDDLYFDRVSQIRMDRWSEGRVALLGDAAACVSLLAGEGTGLAMTEGYVLAGELHRAQGDHTIAFRNYEKRLRPFLAQKQKAALKTIPFFAPKNQMQVTLAKAFIRASSLPFLSNLFMGRLLQDHFNLPNYG